MFEDLSYSGAWKSFVGLYEIKMTHNMMVFDQVVDNLHEFEKAPNLK